MAGHSPESPRPSAERKVVAVAGGALQGLEITYLARKAGHRTILLDRRCDAPAAGLGHHFVSLELEDHQALDGALGSVDVIIPATENARALGSLVEWCETTGMPLAFDADAYGISSSKKKSNALFRKLGIPTPAPWPGCPFPLLAKPDQGSGSEGVQVFPSPDDLRTCFGSSPPTGWVLQEYLEGPSFSVEVVGRPGSYVPLQVTDLEMDGDYDCKRVVAPSSLSPQLADTLQEMAVTLARGLGLSGLMDVEAILHRGTLKALEMDARFPSQTPMAVYHATGINMVDLLLDVFLQGGRGPAPVPAGRKGASILEHVRVRSGRLSVCGERLMARAGPLHLEAGFFGAHEALTSYAPGHEEWVATLIFRGPDLLKVREQREAVILEILTQLKLEGYQDPCPWSFLEGVP